MRKLSIKLYDKNNVIQEQLICGKLDATSHITILSQVYFIKKTFTPLNGKDLHIPINISSWNIFEGLVTIFYENGFFMEVGRINETD
jgi:hypothetical protein